jgi:hypothetical protein
MDRHAEIPHSVRDFKTLVRYIADTYEEGHPYRVAKRIEVSTALPYQWADGTVRKPAWATVERLCTAYNLDRARVFSIITGMNLSGGSGQTEALAVVENGARGGLRSASYQTWLRLLFSWIAQHVAPMPGGWAYA